MPVPTMLINNKPILFPSPKRHAINKCYHSRDLIKAMTGYVCSKSFNVFYFHKLVNFASFMKKKYLLKTRLTCPSCCRLFLLIKSLTQKSWRATVLGQPILTILIVVNKCSLPSHVSGTVRLGFNFNPTNYLQHEIM